jgi:hypothetical protein
MTSTPVVAVKIGDLKLLVSANGYLYFLRFACSRSPRAFVDVGCNRRKDAIIFCR